MAADGAPLRLLTYNVKHLALDRAAVVSVLRETGADVVAIQEPPRGVFRYRLRRLAHVTDYRVVLRGRGARTTVFLVRDALGAGALGGRLPGGVVRARRLRLPVRGSRSRRAWPILRGAAIIEVHGLTVVDVHLSLDAAERARHVEILRRLIASGPFGDGAGPGRVVLVGDLNEAPTDVSWRTLRAILDDAFDRVRPGPGDLDPADEPAQPLTFPAHEPRLRLDGILVGHEVEVHEVAVVDTPAARRASDHLPVLTLLGVRRAPAGR